MGSAAYRYRNPRVRSPLGADRLFEVAMTIQGVLLSNNLAPASAVSVFCKRYEDYVEAYNNNPAVCGREKLLLFQSAYYFSEVLDIKVEGVTVLLKLASGKRISYPEN